MSKLIKKSYFILVILSTLAMFTPVFSGYVLGLSMIVLSALTRFDPLSHDARIARDEFWRFLRPISRASLIFWFLIILAGIWAAGASEVVELKELRRGLGNAGVKYVILWFAYLTFWWRLSFSKRLWTTFAFSYATLAFIHFVYCMVQRAYGVDWAHGFSGSLGQGRFAYGVYRISGFVGHPLTLGYCQALALTTCVSCYLMAGVRSEKIAWFVSSLSAACVLLMSGSRGPQLVAVLGFICVLPHKKLLEHWRLVVFGLMIAVGCGWFLGVFARFQELFYAGSGGDIRLVHLAVHWKIFLDHLWHGIGPGTPQRAISSYYLALGASDTIRLAHNSFLQFAADYGVLGLCGVLCWISSWLCVVRYSDATKTVFRGVVALFIVAVCGAMTQNNLQDSEFVLSLTVWTMILAAKGVDRSESSKGRTNNENLVT